MWLKVNFTKFVLFMCIIGTSRVFGFKSEKEKKEKGLKKRWIRIDSRGKNRIEDKDRTYTYDNLKRLVCLMVM